MTTILKATNDATVSALTAVATTANQISKTITTVSSGLDMLDMFVSSAHTKQKLRTTIDLSTYTDQLLEDTAMEESKRQVKLIQELNNNPQLAKTYEENYNKLMALITPKAE